MFPHAHSGAKALCEEKAAIPPLDPPGRSLMERRFGRDLGHVRLLRGPFAAASAAALGAAAYACGRTIVLGEGYDPDTRRGHWLLAHELAHVVQQSNGHCGRATADAADLERRADAAADIVSEGGSIPADFDFGAAAYGTIQCHVGEECPGTRYDAAAREIWMAANAAIEQAYKDDHPNNSVFFGSDFEDSLLKIGPEGPRAVPNRKPWREGPAEVLLPKGVKEQHFGNILLRNLRGLERQRRPDIIDFTERVFYEIKSTGYEDRGQVQLRSYYKITETILIDHGQSEPGWHAESTPYWYPKHVLPMWNPDPTVELVVCTQATDHTRYPGMILYEVRRLARRRRQRSHEIRVVDYWTEYDSFRSALDASLKKGIPEFDPSSPDYVIIVPNEFFQIPAVRQLTREIMAPRWDKFRVEPEIARRRLIVDPRVTQFWLGVVCIVGAAAIIVLSAGAFAPGAAAGGGVVAVETVGATATAGAGIESTIIVPASMATQVAGTATVASTTTEIVSLATYNAMLGSAAVKTLAATAGVLLILGSAKSAQAATGRADIDNVVAFRAVPVNDFTENGGALYADSNSTVTDNLYTGKQIEDKFNVGRKVFYNNKPHWIFGRVAVR